MAKGEHLGEFEQIVLLALMRLGQSPYGLEIRREIEQRIDRSVSIGSLYSTLDRLVEKGYVNSWFGEPTPVRGGRRKRFFQIQASGEMAAAHSLRRLNQMSDGLSLPVGAKA